MSEQTQPQPGTALDVLIWRDVLKRKVYSMDEFAYTLRFSTKEYPCMVYDHEPEQGFTIYRAELGVWSHKWSPSTNLLDAFEVQRDGWLWKTVEYYDSLVMELAWSDSTGNHALFNSVGHSVDHYAAAYALARCRCALDWWEAQP